MKVFCADCKFFINKFIDGQLCLHESNIIKFDYVNKKHKYSLFCKDININGECKNYSESRPPVKP